MLRLFVLPSIFFRNQKTLLFFFIIIYKSFFSFPALVSSICLFYSSFFLVLDVAKLRRKQAGIRQTDRGGAPGAFVDCDD